MITQHKFQIYFLNSGDAVLQTNDYAHQYSDMFDLFTDVEQYQKEGDTDGWDGNDDDARMTYDSAVASNGGYSMFDQDDDFSKLLDHSSFNVQEFAQLIESK